MGRRDEVTAAALTVVARSGLKGLTHRAVDAEAGLPSGSTANAFRDRQSLVRGVLDALEERNQRLWTEMGTATPPTTPEQLAEQLAAGFLAIGVEPQAELSRVRLTMALTYPDEVRAGHRRLMEQLTRLMISCRIAEVERRAPLVAALLDGQLFHALTVADRPVGHDDLAAAVLVLLTQ